MTSGVPLPKADDLFNRISQLEFDDIDAARTLVAEAEVLNQRQGGDFIAKLCLAQVYLLTGRRTEAVEKLQAAYSLRIRSNYAGMDRLAVDLMFTADRQRALEVVQEFAFERGMFGTGMDGNNHAHVAAWAGDLDLLHKIVERDTKAGKVGMASCFLEVLAELPSQENFVQHQETMIEAVRDVQLAVSLLPASDASGTPSLINNIIFDSSVISRRELEQRVDAAITYRLRDNVEGWIYNIFTAVASPAAPRLKVVASDGTPANL